ncbi:MAG TPA: nucleotidyltransferase [Pirellulales bacterium]|jgi:predicted nucleotidyltransferase
MTDLSDVLRSVCRLLDEMQVEYAVMGGIAVRAYGLPRATYDVDFTAALSPDELETFFGRCEALGFTVAPQYRTGWVDRVAGMPLVKVRLYLQHEGIDVDVFLVELPFQREVIHRRRKEEVDGQMVWLTTPEDLILLKLIAARPRDALDVADVFFMQGRLDIVYMRHWAKLLGVEAKLEKALADASSQSA